MAKYVVALKSARHPLGPVVLGRFYDPAHPLVKAVPALFCSVEEWAEKNRGGVPSVAVAVEQATAAPGETRTVTKPAKVKKP